MADAKAADKTDAPKPGMIAQFRTFLFQTNALALAIGVVIGAAVSKLVGVLVSGLIMPLVGLVLPGGEWRQIKVVLDEKGNALAIGEILGAAVDFFIIAWVVFFISTKILRADPPGKK